MEEPASKKRKLSENSQDTDNITEHSKSPKADVKTGFEDDNFMNHVSQDELEKLKEFQVLDEVKSNDEDSNDEESDSSEGVPEEEIEKMLDEDLPAELKAAPKPKEKPYVTRYKIVLEEKGVNHFEVLPLDWMMVRHYSGIPVYMHRTTRVCTLSKPYSLGKGNTRRHDIPISAIPCLAYRKALEEEEKQKEIDRQIEEQIKNGTWRQYHPEVNKKTDASSKNLVNKCPYSMAKRDDTSVSNTTNKPTDNLNIAEEMNPKGVEIVAIDVDRVATQGLPNSEIDDSVKNVDQTENNLNKELIDSIESNSEINKNIEGMNESSLSKIGEVNADSEEVMNEEVSENSKCNKTDCEGGETNQNKSNKRETNESNIQEINQNSEMPQGNVEVNENRDTQQNSDQNIEDTQQNNFEANVNTIAQNNIEATENNGNMDQNNVELSVNNENTHNSSESNVTETDKGPNELTLNQESSNGPNDNIETSNGPNEQPSNQNNIESNNTPTEIPLNRQPVVLPGGIVMPPPRVETVSTSWKAQHLNHEQVYDYCKRLFKFKTVNIMHFKRWADRRKYTKARKTLQYPTLPEGTKLITIPAQHNAGQDNGGKATKRDWVMNMNGRSYLSVFHEYVRRALQKQPVYEFKQLENASTPYQATVYIGGMQYGVGHGSSKRAAKSAAAQASIHILIPEMRHDLDAPKAHDATDSDLSFFDYVGIEDPRITEFCAAACEPSPHAILRTCLLRNFGATDRHIHTEMKKLEYQKIELTMKVGKHTATVVCKNKKTAKQRASQAILQALHPHVSSWGSLLRLYGSRSVKSCKEKKLEEQQITLLQDAAKQNEPNYAVLDKLRQEMTKLQERDRAVVSIGTLLVPDADKLPEHSGSNLNNVQL